MFGKPIGPESLTSFHVQFVVTFGGRNLPRKTKVRIVGDPVLAAHIAVTLSDSYEFEKAPERYQRAVGCDTSHSDAPGCTIYITVKKAKEKTQRALF